MEEHKKIQQVSAIPMDTNITLEVSGAFYQRIHNLLVYLSKSLSSEEFVKTLAQLKLGEPTTEYGDALLTVMTLITSTEQAAKEQDKLKFIDIPQQPTS